MVLRSVHRPLAAAVLCLTAAAAGAQTKPLTVEEIYGYEGWKRFNGSQAAMMTWVPGGDPWLSDTDHLWPAPERAEGLARGRPAAEPVRGCALMRCPARAGRSIPTRSSSARSSERAWRLPRRASRLGSGLRSSMPRAMPSSSQLVTISTPTRSRRIQRLG